MSSVTTATSIANDALAELGSTERLTSIDDDSRSAIRARTLWPAIVRELLALHPWNFAVRYQALNASSKPAPSPWRHQYRLPADCVRWLPPGDGQPGFFRGERVGDHLLVDRDGPVSCRYIALIDDTTRWPPLFVTATMLRLAAAMAEGVTQSEGIKDRLLDRANDALRKAKRMDGLETGTQSRAPVVVRSSWLGARTSFNPWRG